MNIFASNNCPIRSAETLDDKRVVKMCLETAQLLCTAVNQLGGTAPYKSTHVNHPCSVWARQSLGNWKWLLRHGKALCAEYTSRFGRTHKCENIMDYLEMYIDLGIFPESEQTPFPNCTSFKHIENTNLAYLIYLNEKWDNDKREPKWSRRVI